MVPRPSSRRGGGVGVLFFVAAASFLAASMAYAGEVARGDLAIVGLSLEVDRNPVITAVDVPSYVQTFFGGKVGIEAPAAPGLSALGDLTGPGIDAPITLSAIPGQKFAIPALHDKGDYALQNIRLVGNSGEFLQQSVPSFTTIQVVDVLQTRVRVRQLTPAELRERGIHIDERNFEVYEYGLLVVETGGDAPVAGGIPGPPPFTEAHLVDVIWNPDGAFAARTIPRTKLATVTDGKGRVLLVDLSRIDERWDEKGAIPEDELFPTVRAILQEDPTKGEKPDPRIVWKSEPGFALGTLAPVVDPETGFVFAGKLLDTTTNVISALDPPIQIKADLGAAGGLSVIGGVVPLRIEKPKGLK